jgi:hypothetical protein
LAENRKGGSLFKGESKMPTTIQLPLSIRLMPRLWTRKRVPFYAQAGFTILMLWAVILLSIGAAAHFGMPHSELTAFEQLALF